MGDVESQKESPTIRRLYFDDKVRGLYVRASAKTKKYYIRYKTKSGQNRAPKLADCKSITLIQAREVAQKMLAQVALGLDPYVEIRRNNNPETVHSLFCKVYDAYWDQPRFMNSGYHKKVLSLYSTCIDDFLGKKRVVDLTFVIVEKWFLSLESRSNANHALGVLKICIDYAIKRDMTSLTKNPCYGIKLYPSNKRYIHPNDEQLVKIMSILNREKLRSPDECLFLWALILTGSRPTALERGEWGDLKIEKFNGKDYGVLTVKGKRFEDTRSPDIVIFTPELMCMIESRDTPKEPTDKIFSIKLPVKFWNEIRMEIGAPELCARDFRTTFTSCGAENNVSDDMLNRLTNHSTGTTLDRYAYLGNKVRAEYTQIIVDAILEKNPPGLFSPFSAPQMHQESSASLYSIPSL